MIKKYFVIAYLNILLSICCFAQTAANVPYFCGFEDEQENLNWVLNPASAAMQNNPNFVNKWGIGTAAAKQGYHSLYVHAYDDLSVNTYAEVTGYTFAYREFALPVGEYDLAFSWRSYGEAADEIRVYWLPVNDLANDYITADMGVEPNGMLNSWRVSFSGDYSAGFYGAASYKYAQTTIRVRQQQNYRLVFCWRNNADNTYNPGGSIDNVQIQSKKDQTDCNRQPTNVTAVNSNGVLTVSWDPVPGATYDLLYWIEGSGKTDTITGLTSTVWTTSSQDLNTGLYTFWVCARCPDGSRSIYSEKSGVKIVGYDNAVVVSACPEVTFEQTYFDADGVKVIVPNCASDGVFKVEPHIVGGGGSIAGYEVMPIPYDPPYPYDEGIPFQDNGQWADDIWGPIINLPFDFCFYDGVYSQAQVGANGIISFNANYKPGATCAWDLKRQPDIPSKDFLYKNCIFGVYEDIFPGKNYMLPHSSIRYGVLGEYPCRTLTVSFYDIPMFSCTKVYNTYQMVLYEGTNVIDVYVKNRNICEDWNNGIGIIGIINEDGTDGLAAPGRNTTDSWSVDEDSSEAWRFVPQASSNYEVTWYEGKGFSGRVLGKDDFIYVERGDGIDTVTCRMQFTACNGTYFDLADTAVIAWVQTDTLPLVQAFICEGSDYSDRYFHSLTEPGTYEKVLQNIDGCDSAVYKLELGLLPKYENYIDTTICYGDTLWFNGSPLTRSGGPYIYTHKYPTGCDSLYEELRLTVAPRINYYVSKTDALTGPNSGSIELTLADKSSYYTLNGILNAPLTGLPQGEYELIVYNSFGCAAPPELITIISECLNADIVLPIGMICADETDFIVPFDKSEGLASAWSLIFSTDAHNAGFVDIQQKDAGSSLTSNGMHDLLIPLPENVIPGHYSATLILHDLNCSDLSFPFDFSVFYSSSILAQKWDNVLAVYNTQYNGGYDFSSFRWYRNGSPVIGETGSYVHLGSTSSFNAGDMWQVGLVRKGETEEILSCPFYPIVETTAAAPVVKRMDGCWVVEFNDETDAIVTIYDSMGIIVNTITMTDGVVTIPMPEQKGVYIAEIIQTNGNKEVIRLIVN